jgi:cytochrome c-type biogenesis protein CcsB
MTLPESIFLWIGIFLYALSSVLYLYGIIFKKWSAEKIASLFTWAAFIMHTISLSLRWISTGHPPVMKDYEEASLGVWLIILFFLLFIKRYPGYRILGTVILPMSLIMMGYGLFNSPLRMEPLTASFKSGWLWIHVLFAWVAYGAFSISFGLAIIYLWKERRENKGEIEGIISKVPDLKMIDLLEYRWITFGFFAEAVMIASGAIWANLLWGSYWAWDPVETWSLITWLIYGLYLHLRFTYKWKGKKAAWYAVFALLGVLISTWGVQFVPSTWHLFKSLV